MGQKNLHDEWVKKHRESLLRFGIPVEVFENEMAWNLFVEDGEFTPTERIPLYICVEEIEKERSLLLLKFLLKFYNERNEAGYSPYRALNRLEFILKKGPHADN